MTDENQNRKRIEEYEAAELTFQQEMDAHAARQARSESIAYQVSSLFIGLLLGVIIPMFALSGNDWFNSAGGSGSQSPVQSVEALKSIAVVGYVVFFVYALAFVHQIFAIAVTKRILTGLGMLLFLAGPATVLLLKVMYFQS